MMHKLLLELPAYIETERLYLRPYQAGDGAVIYAVSQRNREHLARYEAENVLMAAHNQEQAEIVARDLAADWVARNHFFLGAFDRRNDEFVAQVYIGPVNWDLPEFEIGYIVDRNHEGQGYASEAVRAVLHFIFKNLQAHRVRLKCDESNRRSCRVAERCGLAREGLLRENKANPDGTFSGTLLYGMLRSEFRQLYLPE